MMISNPQFPRVKASRCLIEVLGIMIVYRLVTIIVMLMTVAFPTSLASACMFMEGNQASVVLRPNAGIDSTLLKEYCQMQGGPFIADGSQIAYRSHYDARAIAVVGVISPVVELSTLSIAIPRTGTKFGYLRFTVDLKLLANFQILHLIHNPPKKWDITDSWGHSCATGMNCRNYGHCSKSPSCLLLSDKKIAEARRRDLTRVFFFLSDSGE